jgi:signal transduction histidine kinase
MSPQNEELHNQIEISRQELLELQRQCHDLKFLVASKIDHNTQLEKQLEVQTQLAENLQVQLAQIQKDLSSCTNLLQLAQATLLYLTSLCQQLRTPVNAIIGYSDMLEDFGVSGDWEQTRNIRYLRAIHTGYNHVVRSLEIIESLAEPSSIYTNQSEVRELLEQDWNVRNFLAESSKLYLNVS